MDDWDPESVIREHAHAAAERAAWTDASERSASAGLFALITVFASLVAFVQGSWTSAAVGSLIVAAGALLAMRWWRLRAIFRALPEPPKPADLALEAQAVELRHALDKAMTLMNRLRDELVLRANLANWLESRVAEYDRALEVKQQDVESLAVVFREEVAAQFKTEGVKSWQREFVIGGFFLVVGAIVGAQLK